MRHLMCALALGLVLALPARASDDVIKEAGREFPVTVTFSHDGTDYELTAAGQATRKKVIVKVYAIVHYMDAAGFEDDDAALEAALSGEHAMQISMQFCRDVEGLKIQDAYRKSFEKHASETELEEIDILMSQFIDYFADDAKKDELFILRSLPGGILLTSVRGEDMPPIENRTRVASSKASARTPTSRSTSRCTASSPARAGAAEGQPCRGCVSSTPCHRPSMAE